jgi:hypothetical protein
MCSTWSGVDYKTFPSGHKHCGTRSVGTTAGEDAVGVLSHAHSSVLSIAWREEGPLHIAGNFSTSAASGIFALQTAASVAARLPSSERW